MIFLRRVSDESMYPTLRKGQLVFAVHARRFRARQVVLVFIDGKEVVRRIRELDNSKIYLSGDNPDMASDVTILDTYVEGVVIWPRV